MFELFMFELFSLTIFSPLATLFPAHVKQRCSHVLIGNFSQKSRNAVLTKPSELFYLGPALVEGQHVEGQHVEGQHGICALYCDRYIYGPNCPEPGGIGTYYLSFLSGMCP